MSVFTERSNDVYSKGWPPGTWAKWRPSRVNAGGSWHAVKGPMKAMKAIKAMKAMSQCSVSYHGDEFVMV